MIYLLYDASILGRERNDIMAGRCECACDQDQDREQDQYQYQNQFGRGIHRVCGQIAGRRWYRMLNEIMPSSRP